jgi:hypothetical protein
MARTSDPLAFKAGDMLRDGHAELAVTVRLIRDWRFRLGMRLIRWGARLAGFALRVVEARGD